MRLCLCAGSFEPSLLVDVLGTKIFCSGPYFKKPISAYLKPCVQFSSYHKMFDDVLSSTYINVYIRLYEKMMIIPKSAPLSGTLLICV